MKQYDIVNLKIQDDLIEVAAKWFSEKWDVPVEAYLESINDSLMEKTIVPSWYLCLDDKKNIISGCGVIENDFHDRKDLSPNLCALYVEKDYRKNKIAENLLNHVKEDMHKMGINKLYLVTDLDGFYEKKGWEYLTDVRDDEGFDMKIYTL